MLMQPPAEQQTQQPEEPQIQRPVQQTTRQDRQMQHSKMRKVPHKMVIPKVGGDDSYKSKSIVRMMRLFHRTSTT